MTDGPTGFHVAPITEDDMNRVTSILKRAMDTMIGASQLADDVATLRKTVSELQADTDRLRNQNNALDEALNHSRAVRDDQARKIAEIEANFHASENTVAILRLDNDKLTLSNEQYQIDLDLTRKERDDAQFEALDLKDKLAAAEAKLAKIAELHKSIFAEPVPLPEPWGANPAPSPAPDTTFGQAPPEPTPVAPVGPDSQDHWDYGYTWDAATGKYWRHGVTPKADGEDIPF